MDKLNSYNGTIDLISGLRAKNNGDFPLMQAHDVQATETQRLDEMFKNPESWLPVYNGENEGGTAGGGSGGNYVLELTGESGTLTDEQYQAVVDNFPNVVVSLTDVGVILNASANMGDGFVFSLLQPNNEISLSGGIVIVNSAKSFQKMSIAYTFPTSSGGLTKTKVTLAELQGMLTEAYTEAENGNFNKLKALEGTFVIFNIKMEKLLAEEVTEDMFTISQCSSLAFKYGQETGWFSSTTGSSINDATVDEFIVSTIGILISTQIRCNTYAQTIKSNGTISSQFFDAGNSVLNDDNFDFYIYK